MSEQTALQLAEANTVPEKELTVRDWITQLEPEIGKQLANQMDAGAFVRASLSSIRNSAGLQDAFTTTQGRASLAGSLMLAAQLHLEIGPALGHFYLTPRPIGHGEDRHWECVPIIGYKGFCELAYRTGRVEKIETFFVREGDGFEVWADSEKGRQFRHMPAEYETGFDATTPRDWTHVIALAKIIGAGCVWEPVTTTQVAARRPSHKTPVWDAHPEEMARKTAVRALAPYLPQSVELGKALQADERKVEQVEGVSDLVVEDAADE